MKGKLKIDQCNTPRDIAARNLTKLPDGVDPTRANATIASDEWDAMEIRGRGNDAIGQVGNDGTRNLLQRSRDAQVEVGQLECRCRTIEFGKDPGNHGGLKSPFLDQVGYFDKANRWNQDGRCSAERVVSVFWEPPVVFKKPQQGMGVRCNRIQSSPEPSPAHISCRASWISSNVRLL